MEVGETREIAAPGPAFGRDIRAWALRTGNELLSVVSAKGVITARLRKAAPPRDGLSLVLSRASSNKAMVSLIIANGGLRADEKTDRLSTRGNLSVFSSARSPPLAMISDTIALFELAREYHQRQAVARWRGLAQPRRDHAFCRDDAEKLVAGAQRPGADIATEGGAGSRNSRVSPTSIAATALPTFTIGPGHCGPTASTCGDRRRRPPCRFRFRLRFPPVPAA